jgi:hypothetical protein
MKIQSKVVFNTSLIARHAPSVQDGLVVIGGDACEHCVIPAGATLELKDSEYLKFEKAAAPLLESGVLKMLVPPKMTLEEQAEKDAAELKAAEETAKRLKSKIKASKDAKTDKE